MKKTIYSVLLLVFGSVILSCTDDALDPLKTKEVSKGTILALRGEQLDNIYFIGVPGAEFFPRVIQGDETFTFDAEFLSEDPSTLESFDMYVIKKNETPNGTTTERVFLRNVPFSEFKKTDKYDRPWVTVTITLAEMLQKIGITDPSDPEAVEMLLNLYQPGINLESDLNLTDGSKVPAAIILASGLFDSDQFYPAQKLTYNATEFCPYDATWESTYTSFESYEDGEVSDFYETDFTLTDESDEEDTYTVTNFNNDGYEIEVVFTKSTTNPGQQSIAIPEQTSGDTVITGEGTYDGCSGTLSIDVSFDDEYAYTWVLEP